MADVCECHGPETADGPICSRCKRMLNWAYESLTKQPHMFNEAEHRMQHDAGFHAFVMMIASFIMKEGYTPYEAKQAAFAASLWVEMRATRSLAFRVRR